MKHIAQVESITNIKMFLNKDNMFESMSYDGSNIFEFIPQGVWILLYSNEEQAGIINLKPLSNVMWECHIGILEKYRGNGSEMWGKLTAEYMRKHYGVKKFIAITPYLAAKKYAEKMGFTNVGVLSNSIRKNGVLLNQFLLELGEE